MKNMEIACPYCGTVNEFTVYSHESVLRSIIDIDLDEEKVIFDHPGIITTDARISCNKCNTTWDMPCNYKPEYVLAWAKEMLAWKEKHTQAVQSNTKKKSIWRTPDEQPESYRETIVIHSNSAIEEFTRLPWKVWDKEDIEKWAYKSEFLKEMENA